MALDRVSYRKIGVTARDEWFVGLDIGQSIDPSAVCVLNHVVKLGDWKCDDAKQLWRQDYEERFFVRHLERLPLQMPYPAQISHVANLLARDPLKGATFALDFTGCGRPVADSFDRAGLRPHKVLITAGNEPTRAGLNAWHVPKIHLISALESRLHAKELRIAAELIESPVLREELRDFVRKVGESGRITYNARSGKHDDLILSICIALFMATNRQYTTAERLPV